jgi:hypothetical protein
MALRVGNTIVVDDSRNACVVALVLSGAVCASSTKGTLGQVLTSTATGVCWATAAGGSPSLTAQNSLFIGSTPASSSGANNLGIGRCALNVNTTGYNNTAFGYRALRCNTVGRNNVAIGNMALGTGGGGAYPSFFSNNVAIGFGALKTTGCVNNVAIGYRSMYYGFGARNTAVGGSTASNITSGRANVIVGYLAGSTLTSGLGNTHIGYNSGGTNSFGYYAVTVGHSAGANAGGNQYKSTFVGAKSGQYSTGIHTTSIGFCAGPRFTGACNTALGYKSATLADIMANITGTNNTFIGFCSRPLAAACSNTITLGNSTIATIRAQVTTITALSDYRDKTYIETLPVGLEFLRQVRPVKFTWNMRDGSKVGQKEAGFIAQELKAVADNSSIKDWLEGFVINNEDESRYEAAPGKMLPLIVKAIQELADKNDHLTTRIQLLETRVNT